MKRLPGIVVVAVVGLICASQAHAKTVHSSDLGWKEGEDITTKFKSLLGTQGVKAGDEFILDHTYRVGGTHKLPDDFTLSAKKGAGFEVTDAKTNGKPLLELGNKTTLNNLTITYLNTPELGVRTHKRGVDFLDKRGITVSGKSDILIKNCRLEGMISNHISIRNCKQPKVIGCHIIGGFWAVTGSGKDLVFKECFFEKSCCDGFKGGADGILFENCVFQHSRDGIDTTGGLNDAVVRNCIFRRLWVSGLDLKSHYSRAGDLGRPENVGILIEKCLFSDVPNAVVLTTLDDRRRKGGEDLLTAANMKKYAPHDIDINDCVFGHVEKPLLPSKKGGYGVDYPKEGEHMRLILLKDAYDIRYKDARIFGDRIMPVYIHTIGGGKALSKEAADSIDRKATGNILKEPATPPKPGDTTVPFACGPQPLEK